MLVLSSSIHDKYFSEFIQSIVYFNSKTNLKKDFIIKFQKNDFNDSNIFTVIFNTEQMSIEHWKNLLKEISSLYYLLDYSSENIKILSKSNINIKTCLFPVLFNENMLFNYNTNNCEYDIVFIGCLTNRRLFIINKLYSKGIKIRLIRDVYDFNEKYNEIFKAKILLNLHAFDDYKIFEFARCSISVFNSQIVLSENSIDIIEDAGELNSYILSKINFSSYEDIVDKTVEILNNLEKFKYEIDRDKLTEKTSKEIENLNNYFNSL